MGSDTFRQSEASSLIGHQPSPHSHGEGETGLAEHHALSHALEDLQETFPSLAHDRTEGSVQRSMLG